LSGSGNVCAVTRVANRLKMTTKLRINRIDMDFSFWDSPFDHGHIMIVRSSGSLAGKISVPDPQ
jgi:hypothetical protein